MRVPRRGVDFVPPPQPDEAPPGDVFEVVEISGEEEHGDDEDENATCNPVRILGRWRDDAIGKGSGQTI